jgi:hypothetical protein
MGSVDLDKYLAGILLGVPAVNWSKACGGLPYWIAVARNDDREVSLVIEPPHYVAVSKNRAQVLQLIRNRPRTGFAGIWSHDKSLEVRTLVRLLEYGPREWTRAENTHLWCNLEAVTDCMLQKGCVLLLQCNGYGKQS